MEKIKLSSKQAEFLNSIQTKKAELQKSAQILNSQESIVVELAFEAAGVDSKQVTNIALEDGCLTYELAVVKEGEPVK